MASPAFVGRSEELGFLRARLAEADAGHPQTVLVEGPGGMGKSALLAAFSNSLLGLSPLVASGDEAETFLRFGVLHQLLGTGGSVWDDPFAAGADVLHHLDQRQTQHPALLVVDDAHLADAESMKALTFALRRLHADRVLAVFAVRDDQHDRLPPGLLRLVDARGGSLKLTGLIDADVAAFGLSRGCGRLPRAATARLRRHTGGNPLYLGALIDEIPKDQLTASGPLPAPASYALLVLKTLASRSEDARGLARAAAVLGDDALVGTAASVAGLSTVEPAVDELTSANLLICRRADDGWRLRFSHPLMKAVVYEDIGQVERVRLHTQAARNLHGEEALLHLVAAAPGPEFSIATELAGYAAEHSARGERHRAAELHLEAARMGSTREFADANLMDAVGLFLLAGDVTTAVGLADALADVAPCAQRFHLQAKLAQLAGQSRQAEDLAMQAWGRGDELDPAGRGPVAAILAQLCNSRGDGEGAAHWAEQALSFDLPVELADSTAAARAIGMAIDGHLTDALSLLEQGLPVEPAAVPLQQHHQLCARGALRAAVDDLAGAAADLTALGVTAGGDVAPNRMVAMGVLAVVEYRLGHWDRSTALMTQALSLAEDTGQVWIQGFMHAMAVKPAAGRGEWDEAERHLEEARGLVNGLEDPATLVVCEEAAVHISACRGEPDQVVARSELLQSIPNGPTREPGLLDWPVQRVAALVELDRLDEAAAEIAAGEALARARHSRSRLAGLARVRGELATARRDHEGARRALDESLSLGAVSASVLDVALTHASYGRFLRRRGEKRAAVDHLHDARETYIALGATPFVERDDAELAACGVQPQPDRSTGPVMTPQEQIVAGLVCQGMTNQEVARHMVLSVKTVGYHLSNIYTKYDIHSRTQLVALLGQPT